MKRIIRILISIGMIVATIFFVAVFLQPAPIRQREAPPQPKNTVQTAPVKQHDGGIDFTVDGQVIPYRALDIAPEVSGIVKYKSEKARAGKFVRKGEILLEIDPIDYELEIRQLTEETAQAGASIHEMEVQIESTKKEIEISKIIQAMIEGTSYYYIKDTNGNRYSVSIKVNKNLIPFLEAGSKVTISYNNEKTVTELISIEQK